jgi:D-xylose transport system substrate-binding protein
MRAHELAGKVAISGQDATLEACKAIVAGEMTVTVYKDLRQLSPMAIDMAIKLGRGEKLEDLKMYSLKDMTLDSNAEGQVPCKFLKVVRIDKDNLYEEIVKSGFQNYDEVYKNVPADRRPPRP